MTDTGDTVGGGRVRSDAMIITTKEVARWSAWMRAGNKSTETIDLRVYHVTRVMRDLGLDPWSVETEQIVEYLGSRSWAAATKRSYRASLRAFYSWAQATGRRADNPAALTPIVTVPRSLPRPVPDSVLHGAIAKADTRTRKILLLAASCGLRRGELARARREDIVADLVGHSIRVLGKGGGQRLVPLPAGLAAVLLAQDPGHLFTSQAWGREGRSLTPAHVGKLVSEVLPEGWTCHTLRHRCATVAYRATRDLRAVQELLGHAKPETTMVYTLVQEDAVRAAVDAATVSVLTTGQSGGNGTARVPGLHRP